MAGRLKKIGSFTVQRSALEKTGRPREVAKDSRFSSAKQAFKVDRVWLGVFRGTNADLARPVNLVRNGKVKLCPQFSNWSKFFGSCVNEKARAGMKCVSSVLSLSAGYIFYRVVFIKSRMKQAGRHLRYSRIYEVSAHTSDVTDLQIHFL